MKIKRSCSIGASWVSPGSSSRNDGLLWQRRYIPLTSHKRFWLCPLPPSTVPLFTPPSAQNRLERQMQRNAGPPESFSRFSMFVGARLQERTQTIVPLFYFK